MKKALSWLDKYIEQTIMAVLLAIIVILIGVNVFMKKVLLSSLAWSDELARYCFIYLVFVGVGYAIKTDTTIKINILETSIPKIAPYLVVIQDIFYLAFLIYMLKPALSIVTYFQAHPQNSASLQLPMQYLYVSLFIGYVWALFRMVQKYVLKFRRRRDRSAQAGEG